MATEEKKLKLGDRAYAQTLAAQSSKKAEELRKTTEMFQLIEKYILAAADSGGFRYDLWFSYFRGWSEVDTTKLRQMLEEQEISVQPDCSCKTVSYSCCQCLGDARWRCTWGPKRGTAEVSGFVPKKT